MRGSLLWVSQSQRQLAVSVVVQVGQAGQVGQVVAGQAVAVAGQEPGLAILAVAAGQAILALAVAVVAVAPNLAVLPNLADHLGNLQAGRLGNHPAPVLGSRQDTGPTGSWPGRKSTWGHD